MKRTIGAHIGFCGIDGAGKTTQARLLCGFLADQVTDIVMHEDSRNFVSEVTYTIAHRHGLATGKDFLGEDAYIQAMSFEILRQNLGRIRPFIQSGVTIVSSRTVFDWLTGTLARGCGDLAYGRAKEILLFAGTPELTLWIDASPAVAEVRINERGFDRANPAYLMQLRQAYAQLAGEFPFVRINGDQSVGAVKAEIQTTMTAWLSSTRQGVP